MEGKGLKWQWCVVYQNVEAASEGAAHQKRLFLMGNIIGCGCHGRCKNPGNGSGSWSQSITEKKATPKFILGVGAVPTSRTRSSYPIIAGIVDLLKLPVKINQRN